MMYAYVCSRRVIFSVSVALYICAGKCVCVCVRASLAYAVSRSNNFQIEMNEIDTNANNAEYCESTLSQSEYKRFLSVRPFVCSVHCTVCTWMLHFSASVEHPFSLRNTFAHSHTRTQTKLQCIAFHVHSTVCKCACMDVWYVIQHVSYVQLRAQYTNRIEHAHDVLASHILAVRRMSAAFNV